VQIARRDKSGRREYTESDLRGFIKAPVEGWNLEEKQSWHQHLFL
jgi:hypothetical protein